MLQAIRLIILTSTLLLATNSYASKPNEAKLLTGAKQCSQHFPKLERYYSIPRHLLASIASVESGRYHKGLKLSVPWPWTLNVEGKGYFYDSKQQAVDAVREFQKQGKRSIDVGCMQINLKHHASAFRSVEEALDPYANVGYGARFLREKFNEAKSWQKAAAHYHSKTPSFGGKYAGKVLERLNGIKKHASEQFGNKAYKVASIDSVPARTGVGYRKPQITKVVRPTHSTTRLNEITVNGKRTSERVRTSRDNGVLVIYPKKQAVAPKAASNTAAFNPSGVRVSKLSAASPIVHSESPTEGVSFVPFR